jgi:hypothetical protein
MAVDGEVYEYWTFCATVRTKRRPRQRWLGSDGNEDSWLLHVMAPSAAGCVLVCPCAAQREWARPGLELRLHPRPHGKLGKKTPCHRGAAPTPDLDAA